MGCARGHDWAYSDPCPYCEIEDLEAERDRYKAALATIIGEAATLEEAVTVATNALSKEDRPS